MRRLLVFCAVMVVVFATFAAVRLNRVATVSAAGGPGDLQIRGVPVLVGSGCPLGPSFTFCNGLPGAPNFQESAAFEIEAVNSVTGLSVSLLPVSGLSANLAPSCATGGACDFTLLSNTCVGNLPAGGLCFINIEFTPTVAGLREVALTLTDSGGVALAINFEGTGAPLSLVQTAYFGCPNGIADNAFPYCDAAIGSVSTNATFTLESATAITGLNVALEGVPGLATEFNAAQPDFTITSTTCATTLPPLTPCTIDVAFTPKTAGLREAALTATDSEGDTVSIALSGHTSTGLVISQVASGVFAPCVASAGYQFCNEPTGGSTAPIAYTLTNTSGTQVTGLTIAPPVNTSQPPPPPGDFTVTSTSCTSSLAPNATCTINVSFTPLNTGLQQGGIVVTDTQGDVGAINLAGVGDDFHIEIVPSQSPEVTVEQGNTATFMAQLTADNVFGQDGEMVTMACPLNLPQFTTCSYVPCPITPVVGGVVPFSILIATSTANVLTPPVPNPCDTPSTPAAAGVSRPNGLLRFVTHRPAPLFPALLIAVAALALLLGTIGLGATKALPAFGPGARRALVAFALIVFLGATLSACKKKSTVNSTATPIAITTMNVIASATDSNGNSINASRGVQITLDVIKAVQVGPIP